MKSKRKLLIKITFFIVVTLSTLKTNAQDSSENVKQKIIDKNGKISLIIFNNNSTYKVNDDQKTFKKKLRLNDKSKFLKIKSESDNIGYSYEKFQLYHEGIKVEYATYSLHSKNGKLTSMSGEYYDIKNAIYTYL